MTIITENEGLLLLLGFGVAMFVLSLVAQLLSRGNRKSTAFDEFLVAGRSVGVLRGAMSMAVSWIWAPAIFICSLQAYTKGLAGVFWFTVPNILCFFLFAPFAVRVRKLFPEGYTLPEAIHKRFNNSRTHIAFLVIFCGYQFGAIVINAVAGGALLHALSGIAISKAIIGMTLIALAYSLLSGLKASVLTDAVQMLMILLVAFILVPLSFSNVSEQIDFAGTLGGISGEGGNLFDPWIAMTMGIPMTLSLLAGPFGDQMFFQRAFAVKKSSIAKTFVLAGVLFGVVPILLSSLGFIGVGLVKQGLITVEDPQMVGPMVIAHIFSKPALLLFCLMAFAGLCSTMDSAFCALSSLGAVDIYKRYVNPQASEKKLLLFSRSFMIFFAVLGTSVALMEPKLLWVFLIYGAMVSAGVVPVVVSLTSSRLTANGAFWAIISSVVLGVPLSAYANIYERPVLAVVAAVLSIAVSALVCWFSVKRNKTELFDFTKLV